MMSLAGRLFPAIRPCRISSRWLSAAEPDPELEGNSEEKVRKPTANEDGTFRVLEIPGAKKKEFYRFDQAYQATEGMKRRLFPSQPPRYKRMDPSKLNWPDVWPSAQTFKWSVVPLPVRQGYVKTGLGVVPGKYANAELMKVPNFFHLTPEHIRKHCKAIKQFCTEWPAELDTDAKVAQHFPVEVSTSTYCHAGPSIRHPNARKVTYRLPMSRLGKLDYHAKDKMLQLLAHRYDPSTDFITFYVDRCPTSKQNYDYAVYLLTAVYFESWKIEDWERKRTVKDLEKYHWHLSSSRRNVVDYVKSVAGNSEQFGNLSKNASDLDIVRHPVLASYRNAVTNLLNKGESPQTLAAYRASVEKLLGLEPSKFARKRPLVNQSINI